MRHSNAKQRHKEKSNSLFFISDPLKQPKNNGGSKLGRQVSDSVLPTTSMISGPILPSSSSFSQEDNNQQQGIPVHKPQSVQFSPEVMETHIIYHDQYSSEDGMSHTSNTNPILPLEESENRGDNESVSSSESASGCGSASGSVSGYEDILAELSPKEKKSFYVAREILTSERTFVDVLNLLTVEFPKCLKAAAKYHGVPVVSDKDLEIILGGLPTLKQVNENLLVDLEERITHWREFPKIADILVKTGPFLKMYADYIKDFRKNSLHLDTCCQRSPLFGETIRDFELGERCHKLGLKHYMLKPVQRMPQYRLLLEDYLKSLEKESEDYNDTVKGIAIVKDVAEHANEAIRLQVNAEKLLHLQSRLTTGTIILKSDRQLIKEGELQKVCRKVLQPRFFALMNDCLFCFNYNAPAGSPKDLKLRYELPLAGMRVSLSSNEDYQFEFSVISVARSFNLVAKSSKEREEWMKALNDAIHDNIKKRSCCTPDYEIGFSLGKEVQLAPVWIQDQRVTMCQLCTAEFTVTFRRHHCRACGKVVCGNCSGNQAPLQYLQNAAARVCDSCYECLLDEFDKLSGLSYNETDKNRASVRDRFKKVTLNVSKRATKIKRAVPSRLEVHANSSGSRISGYLQWRAREKKSWKRRWFVLIDRVLYIYAASEDIVAIKSIPILGWHVEMDKSEEHQETEENQAVFRLTHMGQHPILFQADSIATAERWIAAMSEAVVL
ncbi:FYVE, RhoGEF and PH domain-containing protein 6 [Orchesella cincta]|uniref:FYVE, RhoGEF and PH domain-containing protein 6 n=1 Tax=Orchesella cincta TaxID=48709 RepID=A0A1D2N4F9_ORCCI|nr:FYVE, RhoGEF and PH domain-containing protein 6 [Orchesella cincta]